MAIQHIRIAITPRFEKLFKRLPQRLQVIAAQKDLFFRRDPWHPQLRTHALKGFLKGYYSYFINLQYRVLFRFLSDREVLYYDIGTHDIYH